MFSPVASFDSEPLALCFGVIFTNISKDTTRASSPVTQGLPRSSTFAGCWRFRAALTDSRSRSLSALRPLSDLVLDVAVAEAMEIAPDDGAQVATEVMLPYGLRRKVGLPLACSEKFGLIAYLILRALSR